MPKPPPGLFHTEFALAGTGEVITATAVQFRGWSIANSNPAAPAELDIYDGGDTTGPIVFPITLDAGPAGAANGESDREFIDPPVWFRNGIYVNVSVGAVKGTILWLPV